MLPSPIVTTAIMVPNVFIIRKKTHAVLAIKARGGNKAKKEGGENYKIQGGEELKNQLGKRRKKYKEGNRGEQRRRKKI